MNGNFAIRGFLIQTIISLLDALQAENHWTHISLEPIINSSKVDVLFTYSNEKKVVQIKSSQNQINLSHAKEWSTELETSIPADQYELILIGPCAQSVVELGKHGKVYISPPKVLDISALIEQSAHKLDIYLHNLGYLSIPPFIREEFIAALITKLETYSTGGHNISRSDFNNILRQWIMAVYPEAINTSLEMQCDILIDSVGLPAISAPSHKSLAIMLPIVFVNDGLRTAIIEWIALKVISHDLVKFYTPIAIVDYQKLIQGKRYLHAENIIGHFTEFALLTKSSKEICIAFSQEETNEKYPFSEWKPGTYKFKIYIKYREGVTAKMQKEIEMEISQKMINDYWSGMTILNSIRKIEI